MYEWYRQVSQAIDLKVHPQRGSGLQGPDPPAFLDLSQARIMIIYFAYDHNSHLCLRVCAAIKMCHHRRIISPPMHDTKMMAVDSAM